MQLVRYEQARTALAAAHSVDEVKDLRDKAQALAAYARQARDTDLIAWSTEIKVRAERRCGELLAQSAALGERDPGKGGDRKSQSKRATVILSNLNLTKSQSSRYQKLAAMPEEHFETAVATAKAAAGEVTSAHMLRLAEEIGKTTELRAQLAAHDRATRWQVLRHRFDNARAAISDIKGGDTPTCPHDERGRILLAWREIASFMREELGYEN